MERLNLPKELRGSLKSFSIIIFMSIFIISCAKHAVTFKAANTGIPVLLSKQSRICPDSDNSTNPSPDSRTNTLNKLMCKTVAVSVKNEFFYIPVEFNSGFTIFNIKEDATKVDAVLMQNTLNDQNLNVYVDSLDITARCLNFFLGIDTIKSRVTMKSHIDKELFELDLVKEDVETMPKKTVDKTFTGTTEVETEVE